MECPCPDLQIERLENHTALLRPIIMEREDQLLEAFDFRIGSGIGHLFAFALAQIWPKPLADGHGEVKRRKPDFARRPPPRAFSCPYVSLALPFVRCC